MLAPKRWALKAAYWTGLFNWVGNTAGDASFAYIFAQFVSAALETSGGAALSTPVLVILAISVLLVWSILNFFSIQSVGWINNLASVFQVFTILVLVIVVLSTASKLHTADYVFFYYNNDTGYSEKGYVLVLSLLLPLYAFSGYDGPAHLAEETKGSRLAAPMGIVYTVMGTGISGFVLLLALLFAMQDMSGAIASPSGNAAIEIISQTAGRGFACVFCWLLVINIFFGGVSSVAVTSRILFALCRDKASAFASSLGTVHPLLHTPVNSTIALFFLQSALLLIPLSNYGGSEAFYTILSICVVGLQISYLIPIALKVYSFHLSDGMVARLGGSQMSLGFLSYPLGVLSSIWLFFTTLLLLLPTSYPITAASMNYACVAVGATILIGWLNWEVNSKHVFVGPPRLFDAFEDDSAGESEPLLRTRQL